MVTDQVDIQVKLDAMLEHFVQANASMVFTHSMSTQPRFQQYGETHSFYNLIFRSQVGKADIGAQFWQSLRNPMIIWIITNVLYMTFTKVKFALPYQSVIEHELNY